MTCSIKFCGLKRAADVEVALDLGVELLGFNFVPGAARRVDTAVAADLAARVRGRSVCVGVFVNPTLAEVNAVLESVALDVIQLHGKESPEFCRQLPLPYIKVLGVGGADVSPELARFADAYALLLDNARSGGSGERFDWSLWPDAAAVVNAPPLWLAGGLTPENVGEAIRHLRPAGVDVSSGIEGNTGVDDKGIKSIARMQAFVEEVRSVRV